ncbi:hypothetical protein KIPB_005886 [Kipferlia bialata]|uniref:ribonuclease Z n=1 Tax=Kipferlia bialata TaxID=797122 RepID=A0A9K3GIU1_9EUKA|nr:hypothetical protein KIPB_005886 [Kipferlia bialata]|eukprot:g5886.t1
MKKLALLCVACLLAVCVAQSESSLPSMMLGNWDDLIITWQNSQLDLNEDHVHPVGVSGFHISADWATSGVSQDSYALQVGTTVYADVSKWEGHHYLTTDNVWVSELTAYDGQPLDFTFTVNTYVVPGEAFYTVRWHLACGTQRALFEYKLKPKRVSHIFLSSFSPRDFEGLPGLVLTLTLDEPPTMHIHGPAPASDSHDATDWLARFKDSLRVVAHDHVFSNITFSSLPKDQAVLTQSTKVIPLFDRSNSQLLGFRVSAKDVPGRFDSKTAKKLGLKPGPDYGKLMRGLSVTLPNGDVVTPQDVVIPVSCPDVVILMPPPSTNTPPASASVFDCLIDHEALALTKGSPVIVHHSCLTSALVHSLSAQGCDIYGYGRGQGGAIFRSMAMRRRTLREALPRSQARHAFLPIHETKPTNPATTILASPSLVHISSSDVAMSSLSNTHSAAEGERVPYTMIEPMCEIRLMPSTRQRYTQGVLPISSEDMAEFRTQYVVEESLAALTERVREREGERVTEEKAKRERETDTAMTASEGTPTPPGTGSSTLTVGEREGEGEKGVSSHGVILLGTGASLPSKHRNVTSQLLLLPRQQCVLVDAGEGTLGQMVRYLGQEMTDRVLSSLLMVYITHSHADHYLGLFTVVRSAQALGACPVIVAPPRLHEYIVTQLSLAMSHLPQARILSFEDTPSVLSPGVSVAAFPVSHTPNAHGVVVGVAGTDTPDSRATAYVFTGDCRPVTENPRLFDTCCASISRVRSAITPSKRTDGERREVRLVLVHEATFSDDLVVEAQEKSHSTLSEALGVGQSLRADTIILTHFSQRYPKEVVLPSIHSTPSLPAPPSVTVPGAMPSGVCTGVTPALPCMPDRDYRVPRIVMGVDGLYIREGLVPSIETVQSAYSRIWQDVEDT